MFGLKVRPVCKWFDIWVGAYYNVEKKRLYLMIPFIGIYVEKVGGSSNGTSV
jgi:hypothetical protein